ncbi:hypothetical protein IE81DRAFT_96414 [Ceraceosorus guamensis]|uniref:Uncharacterized protein n=1 Tax=Ceraceosorus guamensis TaxID=1522189 RepID=A0A316VNP4_9BASI|nr:hypothetical protein IE81DRAFT_96414 [Ceraceosorus guamensis]PWN38688.1 hypothetical protein IE81DRAFT_96414 [Ceraceosorus guamensis]
MVRILPSLVSLGVVSLLLLCNADSVAAKKGKQTANLQQALTAKAKVADANNKLGIKGAAKVAVNAKMASVTAQSGSLTTFCSRFISSCHDICLANQTGTQKVVYWCEKASAVTNSGTGFTFGCKCNTKEKTTSALNRVIGIKPDKAVTVTKSSTTTKTNTATATATSSITVLTTTTGTQTVTSTLSIVLATPGAVVAAGSTKEDVLVVAIPAKVQTEAAASVDAEADAADGTAASRGAGGASIKARDGTHHKHHGMLRRQKATVARFCTAYKASCSKECSAISSSVRTSTCERTTNGADNDTYNLLCKCKNGKPRTQGALRALIGGGSPTDGDQTFTSVVSVVSTKVTDVSYTTTLKQTTTKTSTATATVTTTSLSIVAPTGIVRVDIPAQPSLGVDEKLSGYIKDPTGTWGYQMSVQSLDKDASRVALVQSPDPATPNVFSLLLLDIQGGWMLGSSVPFSGEYPRDEVTMGVATDCPNTGMAFLEMMPGMLLPGLSVVAGGTYNGFYETYNFYIEGDGFASDAVTSGGVPLQTKWFELDGTTVDTEIWLSPDDPKNSASTLSTVVKGCRRSDALTANLVFEPQGNLSDLGNSN